MTDIEEQNRYNAKAYDPFGENEDYDEYDISNIRSSNFYSDVIGVVAEDGTIISAGLIDKLVEEVENNARANNETE